MCVERERQREGGVGSSNILHSSNSSITAEERFAAEFVAANYFLAVVTAVGGAAVAAADNGDIPLLLHIRPDLNSLPGLMIAAIRSGNAQEDNAAAVVTYTSFLSADSVLRGSVDAPLIGYYDQLLHLCHFPHSPLLAHIRYCILAVEWMIASAYSKDCHVFESHNAVQKENGVVTGDKADWAQFAAVVAVVVVPERGGGDDSAVNALEGDN